MLQISLSAGLVWEEDAQHVSETHTRSKRDIGYIYPGEREFTNFTMTGTVMILSFQTEI